MKKQYTALILEEASEYVEEMSDADRGTTKADIEAMEQGEFEAVKTKQLRGKIRELIVGKHRFTYFIIGKFIYFVRGFTKKQTRRHQKKYCTLNKYLDLYKTKKNKCINNGDMKKSLATSTKKVNSNKNIVLKWKTTEQVFKKSSSTKEFKSAYKAETERIAIARSLRAARIKKDLTQAELAKQTAMPQSAMARLESGNHSVSFETLSRVAHALGKEIKIV